MSTLRPQPLVIPLNALDPTPHSHEFVGAEHGDVPFSIILVHSRPGVGPKLHRHEYAEVFIVESGEATFQLGADTVVVTAGHVVVGPPNVPHGFTNTGTDMLRLVAIHSASRFANEGARRRGWDLDVDATARLGPLRVSRRTSALGFRAAPEPSRQPGNTNPTRIRSAGQLCQPPGLEDGRGYSSTPQRCGEPVRSGRAPTGTMKVP